MPDVPIAVVRQWMAALAPDAPLTDPGDPRYVDLDAGGARGDGPPAAERLLRGIELVGSGDGGCQLLTGFPGTGKTTELARLRARLEAVPGDEAFVVTVDAEGFVDRHTPPTITDLLRVLAWELDRAAQRAEHADPDAVPGYAQRLWRWLQSDVELGAIGFAAYGANLMVEIRENPSFRDKVERQLQLQFNRFAEEAHVVIAESLQRIRGASGRRRVVILVDGMEKFVALAEGERGPAQMESAVESLFLTHARWLRIPNAQVVYTFPLWLRFRHPGLGASYDRPPVVLPMVKVRDATGVPFEPAIAGLIEFVTRRVGPGAFGPAAAALLRPAVLASGGYPRDLLRIAREAVAQSATFPVAAGTIEGVIAEVRRGYDSALLLADAGVLTSIARDHRLPAGADALRACQRLFELALVLTYHNAEDWVDVHPLVKGSPRLRGDG